MEIIKEVIAHTFDTNTVTEAVIDRNITTNDNITNEVIKDCISKDVLK